MSAKVNGGGISHCVVFGLSCFFEADLPSPTNSFSGMQQYFAYGSTTLLLFSFQLAIKSLKKMTILHQQ
jgi:hypothetical protein